MEELAALGLFVFMFGIVAFIFGGGK